MADESASSLDLHLNSGATLRVQALAPHTFRIRLSPDDTFPEPAMVRYGVLRRQWPATPVTIARGGGEHVLDAGKARLTVDDGTGQLSLANAGDDQLLRELAAPVCNAQVGFRAQFGLQEGERLYGLGDVSRDRLDKRGFMAHMWVANVASYVPIPTLLSTRGWALVVNTTWRHYIDVGASQPDRLAIGARHGQLDYYLVTGGDLPTLLDRCTDITGKPHLLPQWGYGLTFVCNQQANAREMLDDCLNFRREDIPCDLVGLEPGWMEKNYDYSVEKKWHPERFYLPHWGPVGDHSFAAAARRLGFRLSLWLCCDYDLSHEEERRANSEQARAGSDRVDTQRAGGPSGFHPDDFERDEHFGHGPVQMDKLTRPEEPWFEHLEKFVDQGACAFKMDGALQVNEHPDRRWGNGMADEEMHNLYPTLLNKQMNLGFGEHTGRRAMIYSSGGYLGIQQYAATWAGDTGGGPKPLVSMLNHGLSGHSNTSCDMDVFSPAGIHFGFLQPWSQVCSWAYWRHPWFLGDQLLPIFKYYARLRYRLLPYIYSMAHVAARTGLPIMRAMPLAFPDDERSDELMQQYLFGDWFLTGAFIEEIHLPTGRWTNYWTGAVHEGPIDLPVDIPQGRGGPLFVRAGALIPGWPKVDYVGQRPIEEMDLHVYPDPGSDSSFTLYEDDGETYRHLDGEVATAAMECRRHGDGIGLEIGPRQGEYEGMPSQRRYAVHLHLEARPTAVELNGEALAEDGEGWGWDQESRIARARAAEDPERRHSVVIACR